MPATLITLAAESDFCSSYFLNSRGSSKILFSRGKHRAREHKTRVVCVRIPRKGRVPSVRATSYETCLWERGMICLIAGSLVRRLTVSLSLIPGHGFTCSPSRSSRLLMAPSSNGHHPAQEPEMALILFHTLFIYTQPDARSPR